MACYLVKHRVTLPTVLLCIVIRQRNLHASRIREIAAEVYYEYLLFGT